MFFLYFTFLRIILWTKFWRFFTRLFVFGIYFYSFVSFLWLWIARECVKIRNLVTQHACNESNAIFESLFNL